jgi:hypothetical protein
MKIQFLQNIFCLICADLVRSKNVSRKFRNWYLSLLEGYWWLLWVSLCSNGIALNDFHCMYLSKPRDLKTRTFTLDKQLIKYWYPFTLFSSFIFRYIGLSLVIFGGAVVCYSLFDCFTRCLRPSVVLNFFIFFVIWVIKSIEYKICFSGLEYKRTFKWSLVISHLVIIAQGYLYLL